MRTIAAPLSHWRPACRHRLVCCEPTTANDLRRGRIGGALSVRRTRARPVGWVQRAERTCPEPFAVALLLSGRHTWSRSCSTASYAAARAGRVCCSLGCFCSHAPPSAASVPRQGPLRRLTAGRCHVRRSLRRVTAVPAALHSRSCDVALCSQTSLKTNPLWVNHTQSYGQDFF